MKQRAIDIFPLVLAAILPIAGLLLAGARYSEGEKTEAGRLIAAAILGVFAYVLVFTA